MIWPFRRRIEVVHKIEGLDVLARAIRYAARKDAASRRYAARVGGGLVHARPPKTETEPPEWLQWEAEHPEIDENEKLHLHWCYDVLRGVEKVDEERRRTAQLYYQNCQADYDLPVLNGRAL